MKKILILLALSFLPSAYGMCSIDNATSCSLANSINTLPDFSSQMKSETLPKKPLELQPVLNNDTSGKPLQNFGQKPSDFSYNSSCQFGICHQTGAPQLFDKSGR